jgi:hypothetical protein
MKKFALAVQNKWDVVKIKNKISEAYLFVYKEVFTILSEFPFKVEKYHEDTKFYF